MSENTAPTAAVETKATAAKKATKKATKKAPAKAAKKANTRVTTDEKKSLILAAMKKLGAVDGPSARTAAEIGEKAGLSKLDAYTVLVDDYKLPDRTLVIEGMVKTAEVEGVRGFSYYLTAKGKKN